jgi:hypothetical protein
LEVGASVALLLICAVGALGIVISRRCFIELANARDKMGFLNRDLLAQIGQRELLFVSLR